jgi:amidase
MRLYKQPWQVRAAEKRESTLAKIPQEWRLSAADLDNASKQRDLTGSFMEGFLKPKEIAIINMDSLPIVEAIKSRKLSALEVTMAFCHATAIAHQIVSQFRHFPFFNSLILSLEQLSS